VVRQPDHGIQTGLFAEVWGNEAVAPIARRRPAIAAGTHHDDGWRAWEPHPTLDSATGQPVQFFGLSPLEHVPLYRAGIAQAAALDPWTGLLVSMHGAGLYNDRYGTFRLAEQHLNATERALVDEFQDEQQKLQHKLRSLAYGPHRDGPVTSDPELWQDYLLLQTWDRLSLQYTFRLGQSGEIAPMPGPDGHTLTLRCRAIAPFCLALDPYPFADQPAVFPVEARWLTDRTFRNPEDFVSALADSPVSILECRAVPG
jgi:hypothetical protein